MTEPKLLATFGKPFKFQVAAFRLRLADLRDTAKWTDLWQAEHDRAFMVAGATKAGILSDLAAAVDRAIAQGTGLDAFKRDFRKIVAEKGWLMSPAGQGKDGRGDWRARLIYRTNMSTSYAAGRWAQILAAGFPFVVYRHGASLEPREQHLAWDGLILPVDHPFWATHAPPNGWGCSCYVLGARSPEAARRLGGKPEMTLPGNWQARDPRTGAPVGIDKGWAYAPGASVARSVATIAERVTSLPAPLGADLVNGWSDRVFDAWADQFSAFVDSATAGPPRGQTMVVGAMGPAWVRALNGQGLAPQSAEIAIRDQDLLHMLRDTKKAEIDLEWLRRIPAHLRNPGQLLLDASDPKMPTLLLIYDTDQPGRKLVLKLGYRTKKFGIMNVLRSGSMVSASDITALGGKTIKLEVL